MALLLAALCSAWLPSARAGAPTSCADESAQLFRLDIELLDASGRTLFASDGAGWGRGGAGAGQAGAAKLCHRYPIADVPFANDKFNKAWEGFTDLSTVQFVLPETLAGAAASS